MECIAPLIFIEAEPENASMRSFPVPPLIQLLAVLCFYGTSNFQVTDFMIMFLPLVNSNKL